MLPGVDKIPTGEADISLIQLISNLRDSLWSFLCTLDITPPPSKKNRVKYKMPCHDIIFLPTFDPGLTKFLQIPPGWWFLTDILTRGAAGIDLNGKMEQGV